MIKSRSGWAGSTDSVNAQLSEAVMGQDPWGASELLDVPYLRQALFAVFDDLERSLRYDMNVQQERDIDADS